MLGRTDSRVRMVLILLAFALVAGAASVRLGQWQVVEAETLTARYLAAIDSVTDDGSVRADIVDREGVILAKTSSFDAVVAHPDLIEPADDPGLVAVLGALLGRNEQERAEYLEVLATGRAEERQYVSLEASITLQQSEKIRAAIEDGLLSGIALEAREVRHYPRQGGEPGSSLASHIIGFVRADGRGGEGIERYYDEGLTTAEPENVAVAAVGGTVIDLTGADPPPLRLTIDSRLQKQVEKELNTARIADNAKSASALIMDPHTGAILAAASVPAYDAEDYAAIASEDISRLRDRVFSDQYEPGSVMKIFTATAALDLGLVTPSTMVADQRELEFWKYTVRNADHKSVGNIPVKDVIARSRNVATAKIARMLAPEDTQKAARRLFALWEKVGMTRPTGVDISGEATGNWYDPRERQWAPVDLANRAFGQGVSVTLPQLARGISTLVNGGFLVQPHLVVDGEAAQVEPQRVLRAKTARQAKEILIHVTGSVPWYAKGSLIPGYKIGGKTGTAQIWSTQKGKWKERRFNHSFIGFIRGRKQEYVIAVRLEEPEPISIRQGRIPLNIESYELFQMVARSTIKQLGMVKSKDPEAGQPIIGTEAARALTPDRNREAVRAAKREARREEKAAAKAAGAAAAAAEQAGGGNVTTSPARTVSTALGPTALGPAGLGPAGRAGNDQRIAPEAGPGARASGSEET